MLSGDETENKPAKKAAQRKGKTQQEGNKAEPRKRKSAPPPAPQPNQVLQAVEMVDAPVLPTESAPMDGSLGEVEPVVLAAPPEIEQGRDLPVDELPTAAEVSAAPVILPQNRLDDAPLLEQVSVVSVASTEADPVSYQTIVDAYRRYTTESLDQTQSFFGRLAGVRSLGKAVELQTEFAKQAYDGFVTESQKIRELHNQLARQRMKHWEGLVTRMISPR
jgi:hypothetical protein